MNAAFAVEASGEVTVGHTSLLVEFGDFGAGLESSADGGEVGVSLMLEEVASCLSVEFHLSVEQVADKRAFPRAREAVEAHILCTLLGHCLIYSLYLLG